MRAFERVGLAECVGRLGCVLVEPPADPAEAWFLAAIQSLRGLGGVRPDAEPPIDPEGPRDAKGALEERMLPRTSYHETLDQAALTAQFDMALAVRRSRSFRRLTSAFATLLRAEGFATDSWPPLAWSNSA